MSQVRLAGLESGRSRRCSAFNRENCPLQPFALQIPRRGARMNGLVARSRAIVVGTVASPAARAASTSHHPLRPELDCPARPSARSGRSTAYIRARNRPGSPAAASPAAADWRASGRRCPRTVGRSPSRTRCRRRRPPPRPEMIGDVAGGMGRNLHHLGLDRPEAHQSPSRDRAVERRDPLRLGRRPGDEAAGRRLDRRIAAGMVGMPVGVPDLADPPAARFASASTGSATAGSMTVVSPDSGSWTSQT